MNNKKLLGQTLVIIGISGTILITLYLLFYIHWVLGALTVLLLTMFVGFLISD